MLNYLVISIFSCIFAKWIGGSHEPLTRVSLSPFHVCIDRHYLKNRQNMEEIWKDVVGYEGLYQVSNLGRIKSLPKLCINGNGGKYYTKEKILKPQNSKGNYKHVVLRKNGKSFTKAIHQIVGIAFIPNPNNLPQINHKDENPANNIVDNLEWCDGYYNHNYGTIKERTRQTKERNKSDEKGLATRIKNNVFCAPKEVIQMDDSGNILNSFASAADACRKTGISARNIRRCCNGEFEYCKGYRWKFV